MGAVRRRPRTLAALLAVIALVTTATPASAAPGTRLWVSRYDSPAHRADLATAVAVDPDGSRVFVTGRSQRWPDYVISTSAYDAATGAVLWERTYRGGDLFNEASAIAVGRDGTSVFITGRAEFSTTGEDAVTVAYDAVTGTTRWAKVYDAGGAESAWAIAVESHVVHDLRDGDRLELDRRSPVPDDRLRRSDRCTLVGASVRGSGRRR